jgi:thiol-disulfide isomerase/thioredoxin
MTLRSSQSPLAGLIVVMLAIMASAAAAGTGLQGSVLGDLQLGLIDGTPLDTAAAYGTATVVGVWATWCPACRKELPDLLELERDLGKQGMRLVLVSVDHLPSRGERYLERLGYEGMVAYDPGARSIISAGIEGIPTVLVLDADGREQARVTGADEGSLAKIRLAVTGLIDRAGEKHRAD